MLWFLIALLGYFFLAVVFVMDKYILTESVKRPEIYAFYSTIFMVAALGLLFFGAGYPQGIDWLWASVSGVSFGFAMWAMFVGLTYGETSHISPFVGAVVTMATYAISAVALGDHLSHVQIGGMAVLVFASLLLAYEKGQKYNGFHLGYLWAILAGVLYAISHVSAKYMYDQYDFLTGFTWTRATTVLVAMVALLYPSVWQTFKKKKKRRTGAYGRDHAVGIVVADKLFGVLGVVAIQYAIALGDVTLVNAMSGIQFVLMFLLVYVLTRFAPRVFHEHFTRRELLVQSCAIVLVAVGSALFVL